MSRRDPQAPPLVYPIQRKASATSSMSYKLFFFQEEENFGDALTLDILRYLNISFVPVEPTDATLVALGSVLQFFTSDTPQPFPASRESLAIWGSGFVQPALGTRELFLRHVSVHALRGALSRSRCEKILGRPLRDVALGDPGLLAAKAIPLSTEKKKYDVGIVCHYVDASIDVAERVRLQSSSLKIISARGDAGRVCREICECRVILSSSLHGLVVADSYGIPNQWITLSSNILGGPYKFRDYYSAFGITHVEPMDLRTAILTDQDVRRVEELYPIQQQEVRRICDALERAFPDQTLPETNVSDHEPLDLPPDSHAIPVSLFKKAMRAFDRKRFHEARHALVEYRRRVRYDAFIKTDTRTHREPDISVIIVTCRRKNDLIACLRSLAQLRDEAVEIIVVNNGITDEGLPDSDAFPCLTITTPYNFGPSEARNIGVSFAWGDIVAFLDDDSRVGKTYIEGIRNAFRKLSITGLRGRILPRTPAAAANQDDLYDLGTDFAWIGYSNMEGCSAFRRYEYRKAQGMNPLLFGHEAVELSYRLQRMVFPFRMLYSPEVVVYHDRTDHRQSSPKTERHDTMEKYIESLYLDFPDFLSVLRLPSDLHRHGLPDVSFSVIMPTFNRRRCIRNAIDSLLAQSFSDFELILVDDGSTDHTEGLVQMLYAREVRDEKIRYVKLSGNQGQSHARNEGLEHAKHPWIAYLDTDNMLSPDFLSAFADSIRNHPQTRTFYSQFTLRRSRVVGGREFDFGTLLHSNIFDLGVFVHAYPLYRELGGFDTTLPCLEDWDIFIRYTENHPPVFIRRNLLDYDDDPHASRVSNEADHIQTYQRVLLKHFSRMTPQTFHRHYPSRFRYLELCVADLLRRIAGLENSLSREAQKAADLEEQVALMRNTRSWKITAPLRAAWCRMVARFKR